MPTKILLGCSCVGFGAIIAGDLAKQVGPGLDPVEKYGVLGLLAILCGGLLILTHKLIDNFRLSTASLAGKIEQNTATLSEDIQANTAVSSDLVASIRLVQRSIDEARKDILDEVRRTRGTNA